MEMPLDMGGELEWESAGAVLKVLAMMLPLLLSRSINRMDREVEGFGSITAYRVVDVIRIDLKPYDQETT